MGHLGADDDGERGFRHDLPEKCEAVHSGHDKIGDDDVGGFPFDLGEGDDGVSGDTDFDFGVSAEHGLHDLAHDGGIVHDENVNAAVRPFRFGWEVGH
jgi:hypothetical protein